MPWLPNNARLPPFPARSIAMIHRQSRGQLPLFAQGLQAFKALKVGRAGCERCTAGSVPVHPLTTASFICGAAAGLIHALGPLPGPAGGRQGASSRGLQP